MTVAVKLVSELFMIVLCLLAGPASEKDMEKEILIDLIGARGYIDTMIAKRTDEGFVIYDEAEQRNGRGSQNAAFRRQRARLRLHRC